MPKKKAGGYPSTDLLWPLIVWAGLVFFVSLVPVVPNDFWWHLKIGQQIFTTHQIPTTNQFSWSVPLEAPFFYGAWLGELLLYIPYHFGKLELAIFTRNLLAAAFFGLIAVETKRRTGSWRLGALTLALAGGMTLNNLIVRPQIWSWLPFLAYLLILGFYTQQKAPLWSLGALPLIMIFWVNLHGAFILGGVMIGIFFVGEALRKLLHQEGALSWRQTGWIGAAGVLTGIAMLVNPRGVGIVGYVIDLMTDQPSQGLIQEWQSPTLAGPANLVFFASLLLMLVVFAYSKYRPTPTDTLLILAFLWLALSGQRYVVWFGVLAMPILTQAVQQLPLPIPRMTSQKNLLNAILVLVLLLPVVFAQPWWVESIPLPQTFWAQVHRDVSVGPLVDIKTPLGATEYLRTHPGGNLFNEMGYGSYLIWALPEQRVFIDPHVELYPYEQWQDYIRISHGARYNQILENYGADRILLNNELQSELAAALASDFDWKLEYQDDQSQIWIRR